MPTFQKTKKRVLLMGQMNACAVVNASYFKEHDKAESHITTQ